jgi:UDP-glucose 6-dehydrogenase
MEHGRNNSTRETKTLVVGIGEVGGALAEALERSEPVLRHDLERVEFDAAIGVMHICIPFAVQSKFVATSLSYIGRFKPELTIINSTVIPGTTRMIAEKSGSRVAFSPVRGKHAHMVQDLFRYNKFVAGPEPEIARQAADHFAKAGFRTRMMDKVEGLELAKLGETTYFGVQIAYAQELNRYADKLGVDYSQAIEFFDEIDFLPRVRYYPGFIGGHCVIPNIKLLKQVRESEFLNSILSSNELREAEIEADKSKERNASRAQNGTEARRPRELGRG